MLIDEIGRGTSADDGMAIAYACAIQLAKKINSYTLFSTHYFELTHLKNEISTIQNVCLKAEFFNNRLVFLYKIEPGEAESSYGLLVAGLAGIPDEVLENAKEVLLKEKNIFHYRLLSLHYWHN